MGDPVLLYIITWNKSKWPEDKMQELMDRFSRGESVVHRWKFGSYKKAGIGDRVFLSRTGKRYPGLIGSGTIVSLPRQEPDFENPENDAWYVDIQFDFLSKTPSNPVVYHSELAEKLDVDQKLFTPQKSGMPYTGNAVALENFWQHLIGVNETIFPDEISDAKKIYTEGAVKTVLVNKYERDPKARQACIEKHGASCKACGFDFGAIYGPIGKNYIHVHHLVPIKNIRDSYIVDPINDLIPLCANCHSMVHQKDPPLSIEDLNILPRYLNCLKR